MTKPQVSIIVPFFNTHEYINDLLASIKMQSMVVTETIIIDDGSTTESTQKLLEAIEIFRSTLTIHYFRKENDGVAAARNFGFLQSTSEYVVFLDSDDMLCGRYSLYSRAQYLQQHAEFSGVSGYPLRMEKNGLPRFSTPSENFSQIYLQAVENPEKILHYYCQNCLQNTKKSASTLFFMTGSTLFRREDIADFPFDTKLKTEEDVEWLLRFLQQKNIRLTPYPYHFRRFHEQQLHLEIPSELTQKILQIARNLESNSEPEE